ncbi:MAG: hypothetical protein DWQ04_12380 [Chloroflexi bacterium]|nr:MAG: hypothetical protein DWQ04_12380 [Chloroflexota bacterium]
MAKRQNKLVKLALYLLIWVSLLTIIFININLRFVNAAPGRIAYWELNESSGSNFTNSEASIQADACTNCPSPAIGAVGNGQSFDGINDTITVPAHPTFNWSALDSFSVELWMQGTCANGNEIFIGRGTLASGHWSIGCSPTTNGARFSLRDGNNTGIVIDSTKIINDSNWHHITATYDGSSGVSTLHVDGSDTISTTQSFSGRFTPTNANITIGQLNNTNYFNGILDEIAIHNIVLPPTERRTHYYLSRAYTASCDVPITIMPLGDSITQGFSSGVSELNKQISYRHDLWQLLNNNDYQVDFVGSRTNGEFYEQLDGFDPNHEGWPGYRDDQIAFHIYNNGHNNGGDDWLSNAPAEVILLHIGTNALANNPDEVEDILNEIDEYEADNNVSITVILARIINRNIYEANSTAFNNNIQAMAEARITNGDKIIIVDMEDGANINYALFNPDGGDMWDNLHPYATGYTKMATVWFDALETFIPQCPVKSYVYMPFVVNP